MSDGFEPLRRLMLFLFSLLNMAPSGFPVPLGFSESRSGLSEELPLFFCEPGVNISLMRLPGETPRPSLEGLLLEDLSCVAGPNVAAWRGARFMDSNEEGSSGKVEDLRG